MMQKPILQMNKMRSDKMRVIAGKAKGCPLIAPDGMNTRPITGKIKEALFSSWQLQIVGANFLDLFAGSGSMGIEAISRGAEKAVFVEKDRRTVDVIKKNLKSCKFTDGYTVYKDDVFHRIESLKTADERFDIIYLDPPFTVDEIFIAVMEALSDGQLLTENGIVVIRTKKEKEMPDEIGKLKKYKFKTYGISGVHFYA